MTPIKTNAEGYSKNLETGVVLNQNQGDYAAYIQNRERLKVMRAIQADIDWLKTECREIRNFLKELSERSNVKNDS